MAESDNMPTKRPFGMTLITISVALTASLTFLNGLDWLSFIYYFWFGTSGFWVARQYRGAYLAIVGDLWDSSC